MEKDRKYTPKYFRDNHPSAKNKKSSWLVRNFYRKISFYVSSWAYYCGLNANKVSFIGLLLAFVAAGLLLVPCRFCGILAVVTCFLWMICDCVDGNLARTVGKQPYGEFIDACGSYTLVAFLLPAAGIAAYRAGNSIMFEGSPWIVFLGAVGGISDCMARLYFQKYKNEKMILENKTDTAQSDKETVNKLYNIYVRLSKEIGLTGLLIPFLLFSVVFNFMDFFVIFYFLFYTLNYIASTVMLIKITGCIKG